MVIQSLPSSLLEDEYYAAVDLGSNSFHMVIVRLLGGSVQIISKTKQKVRLAAGLDDNNHLSQEAIARGLACLETFKEKLSDIPAANVKVVATATLRLATNANEFSKAAEKILATPINIISGEEEAKQIYLGVAYTSANQGNTLVIDIGGASTEVIIGRDMQPVHLASFNMGCVTFMEQYFECGQLSLANFEAAQAKAHELLSAQSDMFLCFDWQQCLGASGTPQAVTNILVKQSINDAIRLDYLKNLRARCIECAHIDALQIEGLEESRRIIFPSGLAILIALFEKLSINNMQIAGGALREGIIYGMLDNFQRTDRRTQGIENLSERFHIDLKHARRVRLMSVKLIRQLCSQSDFCDLDTESIVATAAALHEIGLHIGYKNHNEHGAYILTHTDLTGFTQLQRTFIRDLVGMHRQEIDLEVLNSYEDDMRQMLENGLRVLRIAIILCTRRKDEHIPQPDLIIDSEGCWSLKFAKGILSAHPIVQAELIQETWLQHKVGWSLRCV